MNRQLIKITSPWLILALVLPMLVVLFTAQPAEAGCGCGGDDDSPPPSTSVITVDISPHGDSDVAINGTVPSSYPTSRAMLTGDNIRLEAVPAPGYYFVGWSGALTGNENSTYVRVSDNMEIIAHFFPEELISEDELLHIAIPEGTIVLDKDGELLSSLELTINETPLSPPLEADIVGLRYDVGPHGTTFDQPIAITCSYDPYEIPPKVAEEELVMGYYDEDTNEWLLSPSVVDIENNTITTMVNHLSTFSIIAPIPPPTPAAFTPSSLTIFPPEVNIGETASISVLVTNTGELEASYIVTLKINDMTEETREITLAGGSETVTFTIAKDEAGTYSVDVNGLQGSFIVKEPPPPPPTEVKWTIIGPILGVLVFLAIFLPIRFMGRRSFRF